MPGLSQFLLYCVAALLLAITPGPGIFYVAAHSFAGGRAEGLSLSLGIGLGGLVHVVAGSLGVSALVLASAELFTDPPDRGQLSHIRKSHYSSVRFHS